MSPGKVLETIHLNFSPDPCTVFQGETVSLTQPLSTLRLGKWLLNWIYVYPFGRDVDWADF